MSLRLGLALLVLGGLGCAPETSLGGSVGEVIDLQVSRCEVYRNGQAIQVTYFRNRDTFLDVVARMSVALDGVELKPGTRIDLAGEAAPGLQRATFAHAPGGEPVRQFPKVKRGDLHVGALGGEGQITRGDFSVLFEQEGGDLGNGRTLYGNFAGRTVDAGYGPQ